MKTNRGNSNPYAPPPRFYLGRPMDHTCDWEMQLWPESVPEGKRDHGPFTQSYYSMSWYSCNQQFDVVAGALGGGFRGTPKASPHPKQLAPLIEAWSNDALFQLETDNYGTICLEVVADRRLLILPRYSSFDDHNYVPRPLSRDDSEEVMKLLTSLHTSVCGGSFNAQKWDSRTPCRDCGTPYTKGICSQTIGNITRCPGCGSSSYYG